MKRRFALALAASLFTAVPARAQQADALPAAQSAASGWLALTDSAQYDKSWDEAAGPFRAALSKADWQVAAERARSPLGALKSRVLESATITRTVPNAPDGEYVVIRYRSEFEKAPGPVIETVTPLREADGRWKVSGYFIRRAPPKE